MSAPATEVDWTTAETTDVPHEDLGTVPDHTASREERRGFLSYLSGKKSESDEEKPRRGRPPGRQTRRQKKRASTAKKGAFVEPLMQMYGFAGISLMTVDQHCGQIVLENAEKCAIAMDELAYQNESVRRVLDSLTTGSAIGQVIMAHAPIMVAVAMHHGKGKIPFIPDMSRPQDSTPE